LSGPWRRLFPACLPRPPDSRRRDRGLRLTINYTPVHPWPDQHCGQALVNSSAQQQERAPKRPCLVVTPREQVYAETYLPLSRVGTGTRLLTPGFLTPTPRSGLQSTPLHTSSLSPQNGMPTQARVREAVAFLLPGASRSPSCLDPQPPPSPPPSPGSVTLLLGLPTTGIVPHSPKLLNLAFPLEMAAPRAIWRVHPGQHGCRRCENTWRSGMNQR
jgi:hypothetical protein